MKKTHPPGFAFVVILVAIAIVALGAGLVISQTYQNFFKEEEPSSTKTKQEKSKTSEPTSEKSAEDEENEDESSSANAYSQARDATRKTHLSNILNGVYQYMVDNDGYPPDDFPTSKTCIGTSGSCYDLAHYLVPNYLREMPIDPTDGSESNTGYTVYLSSSDEVVVQAQGETEPTITLSR